MMGILLKWRSQQNSVAVLIGSVLVVGLVIYGLLLNQHNNEIEQTRNHGIELVRLLSEIPYEQLTDNVSSSGILALTKYYLNDANFAYSVVTDNAGYSLVGTERQGIIVPRQIPPADPSGWLAENIYHLESNNEKVVEFQAPILEQGLLKGFIRLAYFYPKMEISPNQIPFLASIALPILMVAVLFLFLMRREMKPLKNIGEVINDSLRINSIDNIKIHANGELSKFVNEVNQYVSITSDKITDLSESNNELEAKSKILSYQQAKIQSVLHALPEGMMIFDESGSISFYNHKVSMLFGVSQDDVQANTLEWCEHAQVKTFLEKIIHNPLSNYINDSVEFNPTNLPERKYIAHAYPLFSPKDNSCIQGTLVLFRDYTEESLAKNARGEFVAHVAHELKSPLNVLAMYSESLMREEGESREFRVEAVNVIQDEVERLSMLISNLLNITKIEMGSLNLDRQRVKIKDLLEDVFTVIERSDSNKNIDFKFDVSNELSSLYVDKDLLRIALNNLLTNAVKYNKDKGVVTLSAEEIDGVVNIRVSDTGIGISENEKSMVFDKFYRSDDDEVRSRSGHGLGLSLVKDIVNLHNGKVEIKSELGKGTEFIILLENNASMLERAM
ncbi:MAG: ATP-binding protein [Gammaproteobacteria bacterium]